MLRGLILAIALASMCAPASAQDNADEAMIVVTGTRYREAYGEVPVPHVSLVRRADFAAMALTVSSDTRDPAARQTELSEALRGLARQAQSGSVTLGILDEGGEGGETRVRTFSLELAMDLLRPGGRPDTSQITIMTRTPVTAADTRDSVEDRLNRFRQNMPRPGRVEASGGGVDLIVLNPPQYRPAVIERITADAASIAAGLGATYGARIEGLENPIAWKRAGDLDLRLFIPYRMVILPREAS